MREWLVIESSMKRAVFASASAKKPVGYIPRDVAESLLGCSLEGTIWFTKEQSEQMRAHPEWTDTEPPGRAPKPFTTDGCSGLFMRLVHWYWGLRGKHELSKAVRSLCEKHDAVYWLGGTALDRVVADAALMVGVAQLGQPILSRCMILGVGVGGVPWLPFPWRWGYGWKWPQSYRR